MASEEEAKYEMERSLLEWGIDATRGKQHLEFYQNSMQQVLQYYSNPDEIVCEPEHSALRHYAIPSDTFMDIHSTARHLLTAELTSQEHSTCSSHHILSDTIAERFEQGVRDSTAIAFVPPFRVKYDRHWKEATKSSHYKIQYDLRAEFIHFSRADLDPFARFSLEEASPAEYFFDRLTNEDYLHDVAFKTIVACHVFNSEVCRSCAAEGSLQWRANGYSTSRWNHIECVQCNSTYTIQSREWRVKGNVEHKRIEGGSFAHCHEMKSLNSQTCSTSTGNKRKHYIVLSTSNRELTLKPDGAGKTQETPVQIAEIDGIIPRLTPDSFPSSNESGIPILSWIRFIPKTRKIWFHVATEGIDVKDLAQKVYKEYFPEEWDRLSDKRAEKYQRKYGEIRNVDTEGTELLGDYSQERPNTPEKQIISNLKSELEKMKDGSDSWEDCYVSE